MAVFATKPGRNNLIEYIFAKLRDFYGAPCIEVKPNEFRDRCNDYRYVINKDKTLTITLLNGMPTSRPFHVTTADDFDNWYNFILRDVSNYDD